jgi:hypothetical protein
MKAVRVHAAAFSLGHTCIGPDANPVVQVDGAGPRLVINTKTAIIYGTSRSG